MDQLSQSKAEITDWIYSLQVTSGPAQPPTVAGQAAAQSAAADEGGEATGAPATDGAAAAAAAAAAGSAAGQPSAGQPSAGFIGGGFMGGAFDRSGCANVASAHNVGHVAMNYFALASLARRVHRAMAAARCRQTHGERAAPEGGSRVAGSQPGRSAWLRAAAAALSLEPRPRAGRRGGWVRVAAWLQGTRVFPIPAPPLAPPLPAQAILGDDYSRVRTDEIVASMRRLQRPVSSDIPARAVRPSPNCRCRLPR